LSRDLSRVFLEPLFSVAGGFRTKKHFETCLKTGGSAVLNLGGLSLKASKKLAYGIAGKFFCSVENNCCSQAHLLLLTGRF